MYDQLQLKDTFWIDAHEDQFESIVPFMDLEEQFAVAGAHGGNSSVAT